MKGYKMKNKYNLLFVLIIVAFCTVGFFFVDDLPLTKSSLTEQIDQIQPPEVTYNSPTYTDNFDAANDTNALKTRGYKVYYRGSGPQGAAATWFQGNSTVFSAYNGPSTGYVAANYQVVNGTNNIDSWLVLPRVTGGVDAGDTLYFWSRSPTGSTWPDSIRVMYSLSDSVPEGTWTELGRFKTNLTSWERRGFRAPTTSVDGRFAIRYCVVNGGPSGANSDYIGIDALVIERNPVGITINNGEIPNTFYLSQNYPNPFNPKTNFTFALPKNDHIKIVIYDVLGNQVDVIFDGFKNAGSYTVDYDAAKLSSGVYFYRLESASFVDTKRMVLLK